MIVFKSSFARRKLIAMGPPGRLGGDSHGTPDRIKGCLVDAKGFSPPKTSHLRVRAGSSLRPAPRGNIWKKRCQRSGTLWFICVPNRATCSRGQCLVQTGVS